MNFKNYSVPVRFNLKLLMFPMLQTPTFIDYCLKTFGKVRLQMTYAEMMEYRDYLISLENSSATDWTREKL